MALEAADILQGTLDMLILKTLVSGTTRLGLRSADPIAVGRRAAVTQGSLYPATRSGCLLPDLRRGERQRLERLAGVAYDRDCCHGDRHEHLELRSVGMTC
jgi:hypothetical protein